MAQLQSAIITMIDELVPRGKCVLVTRFFQLFIQFAVQIAESELHLSWTSLKTSPQHCFKKKKKSFVWLMMITRIYPITTFSSQCAHSPIGHNFVRGRKSKTGSKIEYISPTTRYSLLPVFAPQFYCQPRPYLHGARSWARTWQGAGGKTHEDSFITAIGEVRRVNRAAALFAGEESCSDPPRSEQFV